MDDALDDTRLAGRDFPEIRDGVAALCRRYPGEYWRELERTEAYPDAFVDELRDNGYLAALVPEAYGGSGLPLRAGCVILEEIHAAGCDAYACHAQIYMMNVLLRHGSDQQREAYLHDIGKGRLRFQAFGVTEPTSGSDTPSLKTRAFRQGSSFVINGQKIWTSRAHKSDLLLLLARTTPLSAVKRRTDGLSLFLVDLREAVGNGLTIRPIETMVNHQTNELFFDNLVIPETSLVGEIDQGFRYLLTGLNAERILVASESLGDCRYFIRRASTYAGERVVFGRPIGQNQGIQFPIARAYAEWKAADALARIAALRFEAGLPCGEDANIVKLLASEAAWNAAEACMQTFGGFSVAREYDIERKWRAARLARIAPISTNLILAYVGQNVLGMPRSY